MNLPKLNPAFAKRLLLKVRAATTILNPIENMPQTMNIVSHFTCKEGVYKEFNGRVTHKKKVFGATLLALSVDLRRKQLNNLLYNTIKMFKYTALSYNTLLVSSFICH